MEQREPLRQARLPLVSGDGENGVPQRVSSDIHSSADRSSSRGKLPPSLEETKRNGKVSDHDDRDPGNVPNFAQDVPEPSTTRSQTFNARYWWVESLCCILMLGMGKFSWEVLSLYTFQIVPAA